MNINDIFDEILKFKQKFKQKDLQLEDSFASWVYKAIKLTGMWISVVFFAVTAMYFVTNQYFMLGNIFTILAGLSVYMILPWLNMKWHLINTLGVSIVAGNFMGLLSAGVGGKETSVSFYLIPVIIGMIFGACLIYTADKFRQLEEKERAEKQKELLKARADKKKAREQLPVRT